MKTKALVRFMNRTTQFSADFELADVVARSINALAGSQNRYIFNQVSPDHHPVLAARLASRHNQTLAISHLKTTLYSSFIKDLYEEVAGYMTDILAAAARNGLDGGRLVGDIKIELKPNDVLQAGGWDGVVTLVASEIFRGIENKARGTKEIINRLNNALGLDVAEAYISAALPFLEMRHLLVHKDAKSDARFCDAYPGFGEVGRKLVLSISLVDDALAAVTALVTHFDQRVVIKGVVNPNYLQR